MNQTILLGEAPRREDGFAFDSESWTTQQLAGVLRIDPEDMNRAFFVLNVFEFPQRRGHRGFDTFPSEWAADEIDRLNFPRRSASFASAAASRRRWNWPSTSAKA